MLTNEELLALTAFLVRDNEKVKAVGVWEAVRGLGNTNTSLAENTEFYALEEWAGKDFPVLALGAGLTGPEARGFTIRVLAAVEDVIYLQFGYGSDIRSVPFGQHYGADRGIAYDTAWSYSIWGVVKENLEKELYRHPQTADPAEDAGEAGDE